MERAVSRAGLAEIAAARAAGPAVVALLAGASGSTPREMGAFMVVTADRTFGTIGGGEAERRTVVAARAMMADGRARETLELPLGPQLDQCCGGHMSVALADAAGLALPASATRRAAVALWPGGPVLRIDEPREVVVYGAGHVGAAVVRALLPLPFALRFVDARAEAVWPDPAAGTPCERLALPEAAVARAADDAFHLVMTHSHAVDLEIVAAVLARPFGFCGLIGSGTKRAIFERRLAERGIAADRLTCPVGLAAVRGKEPAVIAAGVAAQLIGIDRPGVAAPALIASEAAA